MRSSIPVVLCIAILAGRTTAAELEQGVSESLDRGATALIQRQHADDGSWGGDDVKVRSSHKSDYPVAISSLAYMALMNTKRGPGDEGAKALKFTLDTIVKGKMRNTRDNTPKVHERNLWSQGFSMFVFRHILKSGKIADEIKKEMSSDVNEMIAELKRTQQKDGGWTYDKGPSESFTTATILDGILAAKNAGFEINDRLVSGPVKLLEKMSNPGHYVSYQGIPRKLDTKGNVRDSCGRSVQLELVLLLAGKGSKEKLQAAIDTFFKFRERLDKIRDLEKGCHQKPYMIGTFYVFYDYFYVARAIEYLGGDVRKKYRPILVDHFLKLQKKEGHWLDSIDHTGESYGTAMGILILTAPQWAV